MSGKPQSQKRKEVPVGFVFFASSRLRAFASLRFGAQPAFCSGQRTLCSAELLRCRFRPPSRLPASSIRGPFAAFAIIATLAWCNASLAHDSPVDHVDRTVQIFVEDARLHVIYRFR